MPSNTNGRVGIRKNTGSVTGRRRSINLIEGAGITLTVTDQPTTESVDVEIAGGGGGGAPVGASYLVVALNGTLTDERRLQGTAPLLLTDGGAGGDLTVSMHVSDATHDGYLSSTDWSTFNAKVPATRTVNGHALSANVTVTAADVGADPAGTAAGLVATEAATRAAADTALAAPDYIVKTATGTLAAERVLTDGTEVTWDWSVGGVVKAVVGAALKALAALTPAADKLPYFDSGTTAALATFAASGRTLVALTAAIGDTIYGSAAGVWSKLAGNTTTTPKFLQSLGVAGVATAPTWVDPPVTGDSSGTLSAMVNTVARGLRETAGPTILTMGAVADGQFLQRSGSTVIGVVMLMPLYVNPPTDTEVYGPTPYVVTCTDA